MKTIANEIKIVSFNDKEVERQITLNLCRKIADGMEAAGDVFAPDGTKTGFYRYRSSYEFPVFFSTKGRRLYGGNPINVAIKEVVHAWAVSVNAAKKAEKKATAAPIVEKAPEPVNDAPVEDPKKEVKHTNVNINELSKEELVKLGFNTRQADAIIDRRQSGGINNTSELLDVKGIGQKTLDKVLKNLKEVNAA